MPRPSQNDPNRVPRQPVARLLDEYIRNRIEKNEEKEFAIVREIAEKVGQHPATLKGRILRGKSETMDRYLADRILVVIGAVEAWYLDPILSAIY